MPEHLIDFTITEVFEVKKGDGSLVEGKGDYGFWKLYNFYTDKTDKDKFGFMWDEKKPRPESGLKVKHMEYEIKVEGKYKNYNVKKIELDPTSKPEAIPNTKEDLGPVPKAKNDREVSFYVSYMKDIGTAIIAAGRILEDTDLDAIARKIAKAGIVMMNESLNNTEIPPEKSLEGSPSEDKEKDKGNGKGSSPQQEEDRKLRATLKKYYKANEVLFYETIGLHGAEKGEEVIEFAKEAQDSLLRDLEKEFKEPDF